MTKPDDIPQEVWDAAQAALSTMPTYGDPEEQCHATARAILAERERCASQAEAIVDDLKGSHAIGDLHLGAGMVVAAIRKGTA